MTTCADCGSTVLAARAATRDLEMVLLEPDPSPGGTWEIDGCAHANPDALPVAREVAAAQSAAYAEYAAQVLDGGLVALKPPAGETVDVAASSVDTFIGMGYKRAKGKPAQGIAWPYRKHHACP